METSITTPSLITTKSTTGIGQAFLFIDAIQICEVANPTVVNLLTIWLASHYTFNIVYGKEHSNVAMVLENCVLQERGLNSIQTLAQVDNKGCKSRKVTRSTKIQTLYKAIEIVWVKLPNINHLPILY